MNDREAFDKIKKHLLTQNARAEEYCNGVTQCRLRLEDGKRCAIGVLIKDYTPALEELDPEELNDHFNWGLNIGMLNDLQALHDNHSPEDWPEHLDIVEETYL